MVIEILQNPVGAIAGPVLLDGFRGVENVAQPQDGLGLALPQFLEDGKELAPRAEREVVDHEDVRVELKDRRAGDAFPQGSDAVNGEAEVGRPAVLGAGADDGGDLDEVRIGRQRRHPVQGR